MSYHPLERISSILSCYSICFSLSTWTLLQYKREGKGEKWRKRRKRRRIQGSLTLMNLHPALPNPFPHFQVHVHLYVRVHVCSQKNCVQCIALWRNKWDIQKNSSCGLHASSLIHRSKWKVYNVVSVMHTCAYNHMESCRLMPSIHTHCTYWRICVHVCGNMYFGDHVHAFQYKVLKLNSV